MNEQRSRENREEQSQQSRDGRQQYSQGGPPTGFEGMNYEQRRGSYRGYTSNSTSDQTGDENNFGKRQEEM